MSGRWRGVVVGALLAGALASPAARADELHPWIGVWDCGVGTFTFTVETYNPGDQTLVAEHIEPDGDNFIWTFPDGYQIGLSGITATSMQWLSFESGDSFDCTKLYD